MLSAACSCSTCWPHAKEGRGNLQKRLPNVTSLKAKNGLWIGQSGQIGDVQDHPSGETGAGIPESFQVKRDLEDTMKHARVADDAHKEVIEEVLEKRSGERFRSSASYFVVRVFLASARTVLQLELVR